MPKLSRRVSMILTLIFLVITCHAARAEVSLKNGNFNIAYTDAVYPGGLEPKIERVYNSKSAYSGIFGYGWGCEYEVYLEIEPDGSLIAHEYGGGADNVFIPDDVDPQLLKEIVSRIVAAAESSRALGSDDEASQYADRLVNDASFRSDEVRRWRSHGFLQDKALTLGKQLTSNRFEHEVIKLVPEGYQRLFDNGREEFFDLNGKLAKIADRDGNFIVFTRNDRGLISRMQDNSGRALSLQYDASGHVIRLIKDADHVATYQYNAAGDLVQSTDTNGVQYTFSYDRQHNLLRIGYADGKSRDLTYYDDRQENVKTVKDPDGTVTSYAYATPSKNQYIAHVQVTDAKKRALSDTQYDYRYQEDAQGNRWTQRLIETTDGQVTDTTYAPGGELPLLIRTYPEGKPEEALETSFAYDALDHVTHKETPSEITALQYDPVCNKVSRVTHTQKASGETTWSAFVYDAHGDLTDAANSENKKLHLEYDSAGRIRRMAGGDATIDVTYNLDSKPTEISLAGVGTIHVTYDQSGNIKKVDGDKGPDVSRKITQTFQELEEIIRPAGVTLSF